MEPSSYRHVNSSTSKQFATDLIVKESKNKVISGPLAGMIWGLPQNFWGYDIGTQLLGTYEEEIHEFIYEAIRNKPKVFVNLGCADGYYLIGIARLLPGVRSIGVDIENNALIAANENAIINNVLVETYLEVPKNLPESGLWIVDVEGAELHLLDPENNPELLSSFIIVETHPQEIPNVEEVLIERFEKTHEIQKAVSGGRNPNKFEFLAQQTDLVKWSIAGEDRLNSQSWLFFKPF